MSRDTELKPRAIELFTMEEVAGQLRVSRRWLQGHIATYPFYRMARRKKLFTAQDIRQLYEALPTPTGGSAVVRARLHKPQAEAELWAKARAFLDAGKKKRPAAGGRGKGK